MGLSDIRKLFSDRFSCFDTIPACDGQPAIPAASHVAVARTPLTTSRG